MVLSRHPTGYLLCLTHTVHFNQQIQTLVLQLEGQRCQQENNLTQELQFFLPLNPIVSLSGNKLVFKTL